MTTRQHGVKFSLAMLTPTHSVLCKNLYLNGELVTDLVIPNSVTSIGSYAFSNCTSLTIYCEATRKPSGWDYRWNYSDCPVVWGHKHSYTNGECVCGTKEN